MTITRVASDPPMGYSAAVSTAGQGRWVQVAGHVGLGADGAVVPGGMEAEARATFAGIERALAACDADLSHVVKIVAYITDLAAYSDYTKVRGETFGDMLPASSTVQVAGLLVGAQLEVEAVAFVPDLSDGGGDALRD